ncbi:hypothetical protein BDN72DRAFT_848528 [Pluteus cervinus]|uniref:Uncharacterized protein n=1 Tax=Pluteus cervinus TaxID=181527 RepID=A0ACD3AA01_9AGAR|nr:hypothetical protein BDN72DRAFT_848528 [Pluteus cervinus]
MTDIRASFVFEGIPWVSRPSQWLTIPSPSSSTAAVPPDHFLQPFLRTLDSFERNKLHDPERQYLRTFRISAGLEEGTPSRADTEFSLFYSLLMAYRLLDVFTARNSAPSNWVKELHLENPIDLPELNLTTAFNNWVQRLSTFRNSLADSMSTQRPAFEPNTTPTYLFRYVCRTALEADVSRTMLNIAVAALHLLHLLKGHTDIAQIQDVVAGVISDSEIEQRIRGCPLGNFKNPLHVALSLSPLLLFLPANLVKKTIGRQRLFKAWKSFGHQAPQDIRTAEDHVWTMLLDIAQGKCSVEDGVNRCLEAILESDLVHTPWQAWFFKSRSDPQQTPAPSVDIPGQFAPPPTPVSLLVFSTSSTSPVPPMTPIQPKSMPLTSSPLSPTQVLSAVSLPRSSSLTRNDKTGDQEAPSLPSSSFSVHQERAQQPEFAELPPQPRVETDREGEKYPSSRPLSPPSPPSPSPVLSEQQDTPINEHVQASPTRPPNRQDDDVDMYEAGEDPVPTNIASHATVTEKVEEPRRRTAPEHTSNSKRDNKSTRQPGPSHPPVDEGESEISENEDDQGEAPEQDRKSKAPKTRPKSQWARGTKGKSAKRQRQQTTNIAVKEDTDAEDEGAQDEDAVGPPTKKARMEIPDPPSDTSLPSVSGLVKKRHSLRPSAAEVEGAAPSQKSPLQPTTYLFQPIYERKEATSAIKFFNVLDQEETIQLTFHFSGQISWFSSGMKAAELFAKNGRPFYLDKDPTIQASSCIRIMTRQEFETNWRHVMSRFQMQHIVVTSEDVAQIKFDVEGLDTVLPSPTDGFDQAEGLNLPLTADMLIHAHERQKLHKDGKMLQLDDAIKLDGPTAHHSLSTDLYANRKFHASTNDDLYFGQLLRWGHASTTSSFNPWRPRQSAGHFESVVCGSRLFFIGRPKDDGRCVSRFLFDPKILSEGQLGFYSPENWDVEAVIIPAGSEIYIRPFTPYASISLTPSISHGAYFLSGAVIERTIVAFYQNFAIQGETLTLDWAIEALSRTIIFLWNDHYINLSTPKTPHIPDVRTLEGVKQLLCLCNFRELANICHEASYLSSDFSQSLTSDQRHSFIQSRKESQQLKAWFCSKFTLTPSNGSQRLSTKTIALRYLAGQVKALLHQTEMQSSSKVPYKRVQELIGRTFEGDTDFWAEYEKVEPSYNFSFEGTVSDAEDSKSNNPTPEPCTGFTPEDMAWFKLKGAVTDSS